ncbi:MAG: aldolase/citrate lyase family protein [Leptospiraceae bacterium]|nr:aldolase/citrate lyase family protein [Leptospiraceae bacterium]
MYIQIDKELFQIRKTLKQLVDTKAFSSLKGGTETEDMDHDELRLLHMIGKDILPVSVKIGGPEARTDIRACLAIGVEGISAPMIESEYSLRNFVTTLTSLVPKSKWNELRKSINLETITGYRNILEIADSVSFESITSVTAARSDLSASMDKKPDDPEVMRVTKQIVKIARERGKRTSVGGTITKNNFYNILEQIEPDSINSRHVGIDLKKVKDHSIDDVPDVMLQFEIELYELLGIFKPERNNYYQNRIETNRERLGMKKVIYSIG